ncbi:hypothetical protein [Legionella pneumophila]
MNNMHQKKRSSLELEALLSLFEGSLRTIPFNILAVVVLALGFIYTNEVPIKLIIIWFFTAEFFNGAGLEFKLLYFFSLFK